VISESEFCAKNPMPTGALKPPFTVLDPTATPIAPRRKLAKHGRHLWDEVQSAYDIRDVGGRELLLQICQAVDRIEGLSEQIARDGEVWADGEKPPKVHPALKEQLANRAFVSRGLERLGVLSVGADSPSGRPRKAWRGSHG
jgi:hypothetical protein